jgi:hypothetical protein
MKREKTYFLSQIFFSLKQKLFQAVQRMHIFNNKVQTLGKSTLHFYQDLNLFRF